ncbi:MAG: DUF4919 domain-containing protein [Nitrospirota bacterium]
MIFRLLLAILLSIVVSSFFSGNIFAEEDQPKKTSDYQTLLKRVMNFDRTVDFRALRLSYAETAAYNPYSDDKAKKSEMFEALRNKDYDKAIADAQVILEKKFVDIEAHFVSSIAFSEMKNVERYNFHHFVTSGLVDSILDSGDGKTPETAFIVIETGEEYTLLGMIGFEVVRQSLIKSNGHSYDKMEVKHRKTGEPAILFLAHRGREWVNRWT